MSVLIRGMDMPTSCADCRLMADGWCYSVGLEQREKISTVKRPTWCPLVPVPPHGDLIERKFDELRNQPILLFPKPKNEVYFADKDHVWINGRQYISLKRVGEMMKEKRVTNADRIRSMTDEELYRFIVGIYSLTTDQHGEPDYRLVVDGNQFRDDESIIDWLKRDAAE